MRSTGVLSALFHEGAVVCEGDSDRALYQEINDQILATESSGYAEALFINAHSKQSTAKIAGPLREMGIPAALVVDFDVLKPNEDFKHLLNDLKVPGTLVKGWCQTKSLIAKHCDDEGIDWKRKGLHDIKNEEILVSAETLINNLKQFGIFIVPSGELESWLCALEIENTKNKKLWLLKVFEKLGGDPDSKDYVAPQSDDIWKFMRDIAEWINNPARSGV